MTPDQLQRYARHIMLEPVGGDGQEQLLASHVLVIGAGGLGSPVLEYLAAAGVGRLTILDHDRVSLSNLQRQVIHGIADIHRPKVDSARDRIAALNPDVTVRTVPEAVSEGTPLSLFEDVDLVLDCTDSFAARRLINRKCIAAKVPWVSAALQGFEGQIAVYAGHLPDQPCFECLFPEEPSAEDLLTCAEAGVLGATAGVIGTLQATEALKVLLGLDGTLLGRFLLVDTLTHTWRVFNAPKQPECEGCGQTL